MISVHNNKILTRNFGSFQSELQAKSQKYWVWFHHSLKYFWNNYELPWASLSVFLCKIERFLLNRVKLEDNITTYGSLTSHRRLLEPVQLWRKPSPIHKAAFPALIILPIIHHPTISEEPFSLVNIPAPFPINANTEIYMHSLEITYTMVMAWWQGILLKSKRKYYLSTFK